MENFTESIITFEVIVAHNKDNAPSSKELHDAFNAVLASHSYGSFISGKSTTTVEGVSK